MKIYIDGGSGIAGDMLISALVGLGLSPQQLEKFLVPALKLKNCRFRIARTERKGWPAWSFKLVEDRWFGSMDQMMACVRRSSLPAAVKERSRKVLTDLKWAEHQAHEAVSDVDELGMLDTLIDVTASSWGFWKLGIQAADASDLNTGRIAPATSALIKKYHIPVYADGSQYELATPTGVAILANIVGSFQSLAPQQLEKAGYGAGTKNLPGRPNVLALYQGRETAPRSKYSEDSVLLLETVIDDMDPRLYPHVTELLFNAGALDVWWTSIGMKKGRPGIAYSVLSPVSLEVKLLDILFQETTTLGIRRLPLQRWTLPRKSGGLHKIAYLPGGQIKSRIEYERARQKACEDEIPLRKVLK